MDQLRILLEPHNLVDLFLQDEDLVKEEYNEAWQQINELKQLYETIISTNVF